MKEFTLFDQAPRYDIDLTGSKIHFGTACAAVHIVDPEKRGYWDSTVSDIYDLTRLCD